MQPAAALVVLGALTLAQTSALAHDPGQGEDVGQVRLVAVRRGTTIHLVGEVLARNDPVRPSPRRLAARRAGQTLYAPLRQLDARRFEGRLDVPEAGRWFVYLELSDGARPVEGWIPVIVDAGAARQEKIAALYAPGMQRDSAVKTVGGVLLYVVCTGLLGLIISAFRGSH
ncbi:MAG: hypothetical protein QN120_04215 [Armatimonadota bacterium]|nr:hypothetical protein [Armatimonadota bacterium]